MENKTDFEFLRENLDTFLSYMSEKYPFFKNSNVFLRDLEYGVKHFFELKEKKITFTRCTKVTQELIKTLEAKGTLKKLTNNTWILNYSKTESVTN